MSDDTSTTANLAEGPRTSLETWSTGAGMGFVTLVMLAGIFGLAGPGTDTVRDEGATYELEVLYTTITRAGQPIPLEIRVTRPGGFDGPISMSICDEYFDDLDFQNWYPNPAMEIGGSESLVYEFDPPEGDLLEIDLDARVSPGQFGGLMDCTLAVLDSGVPAAAVSFDSWRLP